MHACRATKARILSQINPSPLTPTHIILVLARLFAVTHRQSNGFHFLPPNATHHPHAHPVVYFFELFLRHIFINLDVTLVVVLLGL